MIARVLIKQPFLYNKNSAEGVIEPAGAKVTGATIRMWLLNKFISFLAVLSWKIGLKKMRTKCLVGHIYSRPVPFPLMAISSALTFRIIQPNDNGTSSKSHWSVKYRSRSRVKVPANSVHQGEALCNVWWL